MKKIIYPAILLVLLTVTGCEEKNSDPSEKNETSMSDMYEKSKTSMSDAYEKSKTSMSDTYEKSKNAINETSMSDMYEKSKTSMSDTYVKSKNAISESTKTMAKDLQDFANKNMQNIPLDTIVSKIAGIGVPALVIIGIASTSGVAGGAAIVGAISTASGGSGLIPGIVALGLIAVAAQAITVYGSEAVVKEVVKQLKEQGKTDNEIKETIQGYPISSSLKNDIFILLDK